MSFQKILLDVLEQNQPVALTVNIYKGTRTITRQSQIHFLLYYSIFNDNRHTLSITWNNSNCKILESDCFSIAQTFLVEHLW